MMCGCAMRPGLAGAARVATLLVVAAASLAAQDSTSARRRDSVVSAARAPRVTYSTKTSRADTLRGSFTTPGRRWWDVTFYDLHVDVRPADSSVAGWNGITYRVVEAPRSRAELQIDLMEPLVLDSVVLEGRKLPLRHEHDAHFATLPAAQSVGTHATVVAYYHGRPRIAVNPPWQGGISWATDSLGRPWIVTTDQGMGASVWWPNKDTQADEPDSQRVALTVPSALKDVANGRLRSVTPHPDSTTTYEWFVVNPINNYDVSLNAGTYSHYTDTYRGEAGRLTMDFWPLTENLVKAERQFTQAKPMLKCFEHWFGPFPWYEDGYKLVETPFLGMEHQSAVAYGNHYANGYLGRDLSHTGHGMRWDFILVHESGHEWFGNNVTTKDIADMWVHEGFTNYSEGLYTECREGKAAGAEYIIGLRKNVQNDAPIISHYGVNEEGSGDMYYKASNMLHTMRQIINNDEKWRSILRGIGATFGHQTVTGRQVQEYINARSGINFDKVFQQYLTTTTIPVLEYKLAGTTLSYRYSNVVPGFDMPLRVAVSSSKWRVIRPTEQWQPLLAPLKDPSTFRVDENYYVILKKIE